MMDAKMSRAVLLSLVTGLAIVVGYTAAAYQFHAWPIRGIDALAAAKAPK